MPENPIEALYAAVAALPDDIRAYAVRFASRNYHLSADEYADKWARDQKDRAEAAALQAHRDETQIESVKELIARNPEALAAIVGVDGNSNAGEID